MLRDRLFYGVLAGAFAHGAYLMYVYSSLRTLVLSFMCPSFYWMVDCSATILMNSGTAYSQKQKLWLSLFVLGW